jgi:hypothetical protein
MDLLRGAVKSPFGARMRHGGRLGNRTELSTGVAEGFLYLRDLPLRGIKLDMSTQAFLPYCRRRAAIPLLVTSDKILHRNTNTVPREQSWDPKDHTYFDLISTVKMASLYRAKQEPS